MYLKDKFTGPAANNSPLSADGSPTAVEKSSLRSKGSGSPSDTEHREF